MHHLLVRLIFTQHLIVKRASDALYVQEQINHTCMYMYRCMVYMGEFVYEACTHYNVGMCNCVWKYNVGVGTGMQCVYRYAVCGCVHKQ